MHMIWYIENVDRPKIVEIGETSKETEHCVTRHEALETDLENDMIQILLDLYAYHNSDYFIDNSKWYEAYGCFQSK